MEQADTRPAGLTDDEWRLLRLFRCMDPGEADRTLLEAAASLFHWYLDPQRRWSIDDFLEYLRQKRMPWDVEDVKGHLLAIRPADWPDRRLVDLNVFPDPGLALAKASPEWFCYTVLGGSVLDHDAANELVQLYLERCKDCGVTLPTASGEHDEDIRAGLRADFLGFIREWRERVIAAVEEEARRDETREN